MANKFNFNEALYKIKSLDISLDLANTAKNDFLNNFRAQGFDGKNWQEVQRRISGTKPYKYPKTKDQGRKTRAILQGKGSGRLRKDVSNSVNRGVKNSNLSYTLIVQNPYAEYLNEGTNKMPKRQFVGLTRKLNDDLLKKITQKINPIWEI